MELILYAGLGGASLIITAGVLVGGLTQRLPIEAGLIGGAVGLVLWGLFAQASFAVTQTSQCCVRETAYPQLAVIGGLGGVISLYVLVKAGMAALEQRNRRSGLGS